MTPYAQGSSEVRHLLDKLVDVRTDEKEYAASFYDLGKFLSLLMIDNHAIGAGNIMLACSSEDADWLSKGILDQLKDQDIDIKLAVFWNLRVNPANNKEVAIAPIVKSYIEKIDKVDYLIICKSIISSSCVVRTNITSLIETIDSLKICIASPVPYEQAIPNLMSEFPSRVLTYIR